MSKIIARPFSLLIISLGNEPSAERVSGAEIAARVEEQSRAEAIIKHTRVRAAQLVVSAKRADTLAKQMLWQQL